MTYNSSDQVQSDDVDQVQDEYGDDEMYGYFGEYGDNEIYGYFGEYDQGEYDQVNQDEYDLRNFTKTVYKIIDLYPSGLDYKNVKLLCTMKIDPNRWNNECRSSIVDSRYAKMRTDVAYVTSIVDILTGKSYQHGYSTYSSVNSFNSFKYIVGKFAVSNFDYSTWWSTDIDTVCSNGIHYFTTKEGALSYVFEYCAKYGKGYYRLKEYDDDGLLLSSGEYYNGMSHGKHIKYYADSPPDIIFCYMNGIVGKCKSYESYAPHNTSCVCNLFEYQNPPSSLYQEPFSYPSMNRGQGPFPSMNRGQGPYPSMNRGQGPYPSLYRRQGPYPSLYRGQGPYTSHYLGPGHYPSPYLGPYPHSYQGPYLGSFV